MKYYFCIGAIFKNESHILNEWVQHYLSRGVDHIYLINDNSTDNFIDTLKPYIVNEKVTLYNNDIQKCLGVQSKMYNKYLSKHLSDCKWFGIFDLDEFLYSPYTKDIKAILQEQENIEQLQINWVHFGSSGHIEQPENVIQSFIYRGEYNSINNGPNGRYNSYKCIVNTNVKNIVFDVHSHRTNIKGLKTKNISFNMNDTLLINHYATQSLNFWKNIKMTRGDVNMWYDKMQWDRNLQLFNEMDNNEIKDERLKNQNNM